MIPMVRGAQNKTNKQVTSGHSLKAARSGKRSNTRNCLIAAGITCPFGMQAVRKMGGNFQVPGVIQKHAIQ
jgi:hypothetical protein